MRYWLNAKIDNEEDFIKQVNKVCEIYKKAFENSNNGIYTISIDEMTGIQAIEHLVKAYPVIKGKCEKVEFEYIRHGTTTLIANFDIATGQLIVPYLNATRTEQDFVNNISNIVKLNTDNEFIFICDQLNTHKSESLVKFVAEKCNINIPLGIKGKEGILKSMETRAAFLSDESHRIRFVYTPKHTSWLNQVEIWFSIINRKLLNRRSNFISIQDMEQKILKFIEKYNVSAKPFKWTYSGMILQK
jgi:transposase